MDDVVKNPQASNRIKVELRDLEALLRGKFGNNFKLYNFTTTDLVNPGENYGSTLLKVEAIIGRYDAPDLKPETLHLVAKMTPPTEFQKKMFDSAVTFGKEIYMFKDYIPACKALEREQGILDSEAFDPLPKLYGSRLSLDKAGSRFDHDAVILMENLRSRGYVCGDRRIGLDFFHAKSVVEALARFHAFGLALKFNKPEFFEDVKLRAKSQTIVQDIIAGLKDCVMEDAKRIPALFPYLKRIQKAVESNFLGDNEWLKPATEPWATIAHTDFWINNVMLLDDADGNPKDVKLIDFQNYLYQNPTRDLVFFLFTSCNKFVRRSHFDELVNLYYENVIFYLRKLKCEVDSFSKESFDAQLADAAAVEFMHCASMSRVLFIDDNRPELTSFEVVYDKEIIFNSELSLDRFAEVTFKYIEKNWI